MIAAITTVSSCRILSVTLAITVATLCMIKVATTSIVTVIIKN